MHDHGSLLHGLMTLPDGVGIAAGLFVMGLAGGFLHCAGMCGPFVLGQVGASWSERGLDGVTPLSRLGGGLLLPYHVGRTITYAVLGALTGGLADGVANLFGFHVLAPALLAIAALGFAVAAFVPVFPPLPGSLGNRLAHFARPLMVGTTPGKGLGLGMILGFLPCGMLYGALAAAAGTGSALAGATAMLAFALGTVPALVAVGVLGSATLRRVRPRLKWLLPPLYLLNAAWLGFLAYSTMSR